MRHAVYLLNRRPTKALENRMPFEAWNGVIPHLGHVKVFGCVALAKVTVPHLKKLDDHSESMVYLGVEEGSKDHRLYDPHRNKLHVSQDVICLEDTEWKWSENCEANTSNHMKFVVLTETLGTETTSNTVSSESGSQIDSLDATQAPMGGACKVTRGDGMRIPLQDNVTQMASTPSLTERAASSDLEVATTPGTVEREDRY